MFVVGLLILIAGYLLATRVEATATAAEYAMIGVLAVGIGITALTAIGMLTEPPTPAIDEDADEVDEAYVRDRYPQPNLGTMARAAAGFVFVIALVSGGVVGAALGDAGAGIQTFTFALILAGVVLGVGLLLGYRPAAEE